MQNKRKGLLLTIIGMVATGAAVALFLVGILAIVKQFETLAVLKSPGSVPVTIEEAGVHTLWHDHRTTHNGVTINHPPNLPSGFTITLERASDGKVFPLEPPLAQSTLSTGAREAVGTGAFRPDLPGAYTLRAEHPDGVSRVFSLTEGSFFRGFGRFAVFMVIGSLFFLLGLALLVIGLVFLFISPKPAAPAPQS